MILRIVTIDSQSQAPGAATTRQSSAQTILATAGASTSSGASLSSSQAHSLGRHDLMKLPCWRRRLPASMIGTSCLSPDVNKNPVGVKKIPVSVSRLHKSAYLHIGMLVTATNFHPNIKVSPVTGGNRGLATCLIEFLFEILPHGLQKNIDLNDYANRQTCFTNSSYLGFSRVQVYIDHIYIYIYIYIHTCTCIHPEICTPYFPFRLRCRLYK